MRRLRLTCLLLLHIIVVFSLSFIFIEIDGFDTGAVDEEFSEELLLKPLPDRKLLAHFLFQSSTPHTSTYGRHHRLFPKAIYQLVQKFRVREMELSFSQGRWNYQRWGGFDSISSNIAKPPGVELWAVFEAPENQVDASWKNLTHVLSGLFCASINFLESPTTYSSPHWHFRTSSGSLRYGALPREAVCTENLTPWLKLLPCRDKAGISILLDRPSIYSGFYHSQRLHLISTEFSSVGEGYGIVLEQSLSVVLQPRTEIAQSLQPSWSLSSIFGKKISGICTLAKYSNVYLHLERGLVSSLNSLHNKKYVSDELWTDPAFKLSVSPDRVFKEVDSPNLKSSSILYEFSIKRNNNSEEFDMGMIWKSTVPWSSSQAPMHASRFLMGSGNERGAIAISLMSNEVNEGPQGVADDVDVDDKRCMFRVDIFQVVPWYIKIYYHTIQIFLDGHPHSSLDVIETMHVSPSKDRVSPGVMELVLKVACFVNTVAITIEFDKGFLHIDEYPPDANQGFDIPSAIINFPDFTTTMHFVREELQSPMLSRLQTVNSAQLYTEVLLVPLSTPDFSMPYNVITITCTVFALYFGSLLNVLRRRVGEEQRLMKNKAAKKSGRIILSKIVRWMPSSSVIRSKLILTAVMAAAIAIVLHRYLE